MTAEQGPLRLCHSEHRREPPVTVRLIGEIDELSMPGGTAPPCLIRAFAALGPNPENRDLEQRPPLKKDA
jgi:hypothetical protein